MKFSAAACCVLIWGFLGVSARAQWQVVADGIEYRTFTLSDPNNVYVTRMDRDDPDCIIESSVGQGRLSGGAERVRDQASR